MCLVPGSTAPITCLHIQCVCTRDHQSSTVESVNAIGIGDWIVCLEATFETQSYWGSDFRYHYGGGGIRIRSGFVGYLGQLLSCNATLHCILLSLAGYLFVTRKSNKQTRQETSSSPVAKYLPVSVGRQSPTPAIPSRRVRRSAYRLPCRRPSGCARCSCNRR